MILYCLYASSLSCLVLSCLALSCLVLSCLVLSCLILSYLILSCRVVSCRVVSCRVLSCTWSYFPSSRVSILSSNHAYREATARRNRLRERSRRSHRILCRPNLTKTGLERYRVRRIRRQSAPSGRHGWVVFVRYIVLPFNVVGVQA